MTLADEDTNSILIDNANRAFLRNVAMQHTAPERCQPEKFATLSFSAILVVCDQDKKLQVGQQIL